MSKNLIIVESPAKAKTIQKFITKDYTVISSKGHVRDLPQKDLGIDVSKNFLPQYEILPDKKKLISDSISQDEFKSRMRETLGIGHFLDHYGMVEQTGCIYAECECGHLHASNYSDVIIRDAEDFSVKGIGEKGIMQTVSVLPHSYPGHSLLTEDEGVILGEDDCPCGRKGKYIQIIGRLKSAEIRGCSDTYADKMKL